MKERVWEEDKEGFNRGKEKRKWFYYIVILKDKKND